MRALLANILLLTCSAVFANNSEECCSANRWFSNASFIYWQAKLDGLSYAATGYRNEVTGQNPSKGELKRPDFDFKPGFKVGLGAHLPHDCWELYSEYTWLDTGSVSGSSTSSGLTPRWYNPSTNPPLEPGSPFLNSARASYRTNINVVDLNLARPFYVSSSLLIKPRLGLKGAYLSHKYDVNYQSQWHIDLDQTFWGIGIHGAFDTKWWITEKFGLYGNVAISPLWGEFDSKRKDTESGETYLNTNYQFHTIKPVLELALGLNFKTPIGASSQFLISGGYEGQIWFSQNQFLRTYAPKSCGDLTLQGLTLKFRFDF